MYGIVRFVRYSTSTERENKSSSLINVENIVNLIVYCNNSCLALTRGEGQLRSANDIILLSISLPYGLLQLLSTEDS